MSAVAKAAPAAGGGAGPLPAGVRIGYGLGSLCTGTFGTVPGLILLYYLTDVLAVPAAVAGAAVFLPKAWDVLVNPLVGAVSDRSTWRQGPRRPFLLIGACTLPPLFALLFAAPPVRGAAAAGYVAVVFLLAATAYAVFQVPYVTMPAEMTEDDAERGRMLGWRVGFLGAAILLSGAVAPALAHAGGDTPGGYRLMGVAVAGLLAVGMFGAWHTTRRAPVVARSRAEPSLRAQLAAVRDNRPFRYLAGMWTVQALAVGVLLAGVQYFATYTLGSPGAVTPLFAAMIGPLVLVMPLWNRLARRRGTGYAQGCASVLFVAGTVALALTGVAGPWLGYAAAAVVGVAYAGLQLLPLTMLADTLAADAARTGSRRAATFTGLWTAAETLALAVGAGVFAALLALSGFHPSDAAHRGVQPQAALTAITAGTGLVPAVLAAASLWLLHRYRTEARPAGPPPVPEACADAAGTDPGPTAATTPTPTPVTLPAAAPAHTPAPAPEDGSTRVT
ncbi:MFS transporter [Kitasatospora herbaricolor]|uniref:MFS transporter n=1 Tax=Kitasatospora herbaricolor TaxID=68217 RepID=UPI00174A4F7B|nr:MFS transporter [Kitasatospora herbaricolor]MDQ0312471.1 GPH family glycoside/pentoside/hexuronide:cation symporter [Kitasatospora herbaricolor]GGV48869.1 MFS transporter [Kitasatospora herbaricolor]